MWIAGLIDWILASESQSLLCRHGLGYYFWRLFEDEILLRFLAQLSVLEIFQNFEVCVITASPRQLGISCSNYQLVFSIDKLFCARLDRFLGLQRWTVLYVCALLWFCFFGCHVEMHLSNLWSWIIPKQFKIAVLQMWLCFVYYF